MSRIAAIIIISGFFFPIFLLDARNLPGIDPSSMAVDPDPNYSVQPLSKDSEKGDADKEEKSDQTIPPGEAEKLDPVITGLGVRRMEDEPYSVELKWNISSRNESPIYVARSESPIDTRAKVMNAENLTSPPLSPQETSFVDKNIPNGNYYYAVLTKNEIASRGPILLKKGANTSIEPIAILRQDETKGPPIAKEEKLDEYRVFGLTAVDQNNAVQLKWLPARASNIKYTIYRGYTPLDTKERIDTSQKLGVVEQGKEEFLDTAPLKNRAVFYGVTVTDKETNREVTSLVLRQSYIQHSFGNKDERNFLADFPGAIIVASGAQKTLNVYWTDPETHFDEIIVFRSASPISSEDKLKEAEKIGSVKRGIKKFEDANLEPGYYYYAIFPKNGDNVRIAFLEDRTYTTNSVAVRIPEKKEEPAAAEKEKPEIAEIPEVKKEVEEKKEDITSELLYFRMITSKDSVKLIWEVSKYDPNIKFLVFRSKKFMQTYRDVQRNGQMLDEIPAYIKEYVDESLPEGIYYYALVLERNKEIDQMLVAGKNYVLEPAIISNEKEEPQITEKKVEEPEVIEPNEKVEDDSSRDQEKDIAETDDDMKLYQDKLDELNRILARTFIKNKYGEAVELLKTFTVDRNIPEGVRARALFYSGLSYFNMRKYKQALFYFSNSEVRSYYPARSDFWIKRSVEKIR